MRSVLYRMSDIERILSRISTLKAGPHELLALADALERLNDLAEILENIDAEIVKRAVERMSIDVRSLSLIRRSIDPESGEIVGGYNRDKGVRGNGIASQ